MKVRELKLEPLVDCEAGDSLADAADRMRFYEIGSLLVMDEGVPVGIITERDIVRSVAERSNAAMYPVRAYMTSEPSTIDGDADVVNAGELMLALGVRHLPVVDGVEVTGMVSARDLLTVEIEREVALAAVE